MGALNSFGLWGTLAAIGVAVPIIIHLLYRKQRKQTDWAAMELLRRALVVRSGQVKLEDYLILALRCLALLLIAFALLRPTLNSDSSGWLGEQRTGMVVAIDGSFSMNHGDYSRFEKAVDKARKIFQEANPGDPVSLVLMSSRPQVLLRGTGYDEAQVTGILDSLEDATPFGLGLDQNLEQLAELVAEFKTAGKECYLISDSQELDWASLSTGAQTAIGRIKEEASVYVVPVSGDGEENLSLSALSYASGSLHKTGVARFSAKVRNTGTRATSGGSVDFYVGDNRQPARSIGPLEPGEQRDIDFFVPFEQPGHIRLKAELSKDELPDDNVRFAVADISPAVNVLCVEGTRPASDERGGAYYAAKAIRPKDTGPEAPLQVSTIPATDLELEDFNNYGVIILTDVADLAPEHVVRLNDFAKRGGGVMIFVGENVDPEQYNERLAELLPAKLLEPAVFENEQEVGWAIAKVKSDHLLAAVVGRLPEAVLNTARFEKIMRAEPLPGGETILSIAELDTPLLMSRQIGTGNVLLFTTSADRSWNELPVHPLYTMLVRQAVTNLTSRPDALQLTVGERSDLAVSGREVGESVSIEGPDGTASGVKLSGATGEALAAFEPETVGIYTIAAGGANQPGTTVAANVDASESAVRTLDAGALEAKLDPLGAQVIAPERNLARAIEDGRRGRELAHWLLWIGIALFILQSVLAKHFTNKMKREDSADLSATLQLSRVAAARRS